MSGASVDGPCPRRKDFQDEIRPQGRQPARAGPDNGQGGDNGPEPRLRGRCRFAQGHSRRDAHKPERQDRGGARAQGTAALLRPVPPGGVSGPARLAVPVQTLCRYDGA